MAALGRAAAATAALVGIFIAAPACAYVGDSFLKIPGVAGDSRGAKYDHWVTIDANYWKAEEGGMYASLRQTLRRPKQFYSTPPAPHAGAGSLMISIDKRSPVLPAMMKRCADKSVMPELIYAESSDLSRSLRELGPRPADIPEYFEYRLKDVSFTDCPVVQGAVDQALVVSFNDIEWLNYHGQPEGEAVALAPSPVALESSAASPANVDLPAPDKPVNHKVKPSLIVMKRCSLKIHYKINQVSYVSSSTGATSDTLNQPLRFRSIGKSR